MKRVAHFLVVAGLAGAWAGCAKDPELVETSQSVPSSSEAVLVKLNVPNMTWGGCAASVRGDLEKIAGVTDIETDIANRVCSFKVTKPDIDYKSKLAEYAKTNTHLAGYVIQ